MKSKEEFVKKEKYLLGYMSKIYTFEDIMNEYNDIQSLISKYTNEKEKYDKKLGSNRRLSFFGTKKATLLYISLYSSYLQNINKENGDFSFTHYFKLHSVINYLLSIRLGKELKCIYGDFSTKSGKS